MEVCGSTPTQQKAPGTPRRPSPRGGRLRMESPAAAVQTILQTQPNQITMCGQYRRSPGTGWIPLGSITPQYPQIRNDLIRIFIHDLCRSDGHGGRTHEIPWRQPASCQSIREIRSWQLQTNPKSCVTALVDQTREYQTDSPSKPPVASA